MKKQISLVGVPLDLGQTRRGVDMGPSAIRYAEIIQELIELGYIVEDLGDMNIKRARHSGKHSTGNKLKNLQEVMESCEVLAGTVDLVVQKGAFPLILGGDHSIAIGSVAGIAKHYKNLGVIWFDAHGDLNTPETTPSGNIHGMSLAVNLGYGDASLTNLYGYKDKVKPENVVIIGARSLDEGEQVFIREKKIKVYTMHEIDKLGMSGVMEGALHYLGETDGIHLSLDLDGLDPHDAPGVGTPVRGGISYRESHLAMEMLAEANVITSVELVEVNPILDERNKTAIAAVGLMSSLFGRRILSK